MWKEINDNSLYSISIEGQIKNNETNRILKPDKSSKGYLMIRLGKLKKHYLVHRLVAIHFIPNINNKPQVNHIDGNKTNNHVSNLEWCTNIENTLHSYSISGINKNITTKEQYDSIILYTQQGMKFGDIVKIMGMNRNTVMAIRRGYNGQRFKLVE